MHKYSIIYMYLRHMISYSQIDVRTIETKYNINRVCHKSTYLSIKHKAK